MKGLFLKEFYNIRDDIGYLFILEIFILVIYLIVNAPLVDLISGFIVFFIISSVYLRCEMLNYKNNSNMYERTFPINLNKIILSKYLFIFSLTLIIIFISFIISLFIKEDIQFLGKIKYSFAYMFFINFSLIYVPISYFFLVLSKGNFVVVLISNFIGMISSLFLNVLFLTGVLFSISKIKNVIVEELPNSIFVKSSLLNLLFSFIIMFLIYKLTCFIYKKQSL